MKMNKYCNIVFLVASLFIIIGCTPKESSPSVSGDSENADVDHYRSAATSDFSNPESFEALKGEIDKAAGDDAISDKEYLKQFFQNSPHLDRELAGKIAKAKLKESQNYQPPDINRTKIKGTEDGGLIYYFFTSEGQYIDTVLIDKLGLAKLVSESNKDQEV